jgi:hypothetical protein
MTYKTRVIRRLSILQILVNMILVLFLLIFITSEGLEVVTKSLKAIILFCYQKSFSTNVYIGKRYRKFFGSRIYLTPSPVHFLLALLSFCILNSLHTLFQHYISTSMTFSVSKIVVSNGLWSLPTGLVRRLQIKYCRK